MRICERYLARSGYLFNGYVSLPVYGEFLSKIIDEKKSFDMLLIFGSTLRERKIKYYTPRDKAFEIYKEIRKMDPRIGYTDAFILACAIEQRHSTFVTVDKDLVGNERIEKKYKINIYHPADLIK